MAENVGGIFWTAEMRTESLLPAAKKVDRTLDMTQASFTRTGKAAERMNTQVSKTAKGVSRSMGGMGRSAGQVGIQFQQLVGQIQGGQNAMAALSMQAADIGIVMGAPLIGAIAGLAAAFGGALVPSLFDSKDATQELEEAQEKLGDAVERNQRGVPILTQRIRELAKVSRSAALAELAQEAIDARDLIRTAGEGIQETVQESFNFEQATKGFARFQAAIEAGGARADAALAILEGRVATQDKQYVALQSTIRSLNREFDLSFEQSTQLLDALARVESDGSADSIQNLQNVLGQLNGEFGNSNEALISFQSSLSNFFKAARDGSLTLQDVARLQENFDQALQSSTEAAQQNETALTGLVESIARQAATMGMTEKGIALYTAEMMGASEGMKEQIRLLYDYIEQKKQEQEAERDATKEKESAIASYAKLKEQLQQNILEMTNSDAAFEQYIQKQRENAEAAGKSADEIERLIRKERELKDQREQRNQQEKIEQNKQKELAELDRELTLMQMKNTLGNTAYQTELALQNLKRQGIELNEQERMQVAERIAQMQQLRLQSKLAGEDINESFGNIAAGALDQFSQGMAQLIVQGGSAREVFSSLASTIATELLSAIIRYWIGQAAAAVAGQSAATAAGVAQASALTAAYTPAAIAANIATFGAAATAAAAAAPVAAGATIAAVQSGALGAGRLNGGPVSAGSIHPITEDGNPEILQQGGKQYLLPGSRGGNVVSNKDMKQVGGGSSVMVNVNNYGGEQVQVKDRGFNSAQQKQIIDVFVGDMNRRGRSWNAVTTTTDAKNRTR